MSDTATSSSREKSSTPTAAKQTVTPNGTVIAYESKPVRRYLVNGEDGYVSVTEALECLDKPALPWWGMTIGVKGVHALVGMGIARLGQRPDGGFTMAIAQDGVWVEATPELLVEALTEIKQTVNHVRDSAGDRGQSAHDALEAWGVTGELPDPSQYTFEEQPYVQGLRAFLEVFGPHFEVTGNEVMVASMKHKYAGRYDIRGKLRQDVKVITKVYPKTAPKHILVPAGSGLIDLKTSKDVFDKHFLQLEGYEGASIECGHEPTDWRAVLQIGADGRYQFRLVKNTTPDDYAQVVATYRAMQRVKEGLKVQR